MMDVDEAGYNEEEETLDEEFELETSEEDGFTEKSLEKRDFQSVLDLGGKEPADLNNILWRLGTRSFRPKSPARFLFRGKHIS